MPAYDSTLTGLFEAQADGTPDSPAVVHEHGTMTYAELTRQADVLAGRLIGRGLGPGRIVALAVPRTAELIVTMFAILKAGAAYLPLDLRHVDGRAAAILQESGAAALVFSNGDAEARRLAEKFRGLAVALEESVWPPAANADEGGSRHAGTPQPGDLAYVIYTSGSTGRPKGVAVEHRSIAHLSVEMSRLLGPERTARVLASTSIGFDVSAFEIFCPLVSGGAVHLVQNALEIADQSPLVRRATLISAVPSVVAHLLDADALPAGPKTLVLAGEELTPALARQLRATLPKYTLVNAYGPTEATVYATVSPLDTDFDGPPPIGRPLPGVLAYVLDDELKTLPVGAAGELYVSGVGVARGYLNRPDLTQERFVADPYGPRGTRMYRTGDLARWTADGLLEYAGRIDDQVKIRGIRIEPGEVEAVLGEYPGVTRAVVVAGEVHPGDKALVAYVTIARGAVVDLTALREFASGSLPDYMVPTVIRVLDSVPLTQHGKLDRNALAAPEFRTPEHDPATPTGTEGRVRALFSEFLGVVPIGADDDFFTLGGHSLLAIRLIGRIRREFGVAIPIRAFRLEPSVAGIVRLLTQRG